MSKLNKSTFIPLSVPIPIKNQIWPKGTIPLVSVYTLTFNHDSCIHDCIDSILMQETIFPVKVCVFEDCSTDNTVKILNKYKVEYPDLIYLFCQRENTYNDYRKRINAQKPFIQALHESKYCAICEGDDFWIDPFKLQKQISFLEDNPKVNFSMGTVKILNTINGSTSYRTGPRFNKANGIYSLKDYIRFPFSQTSSFIYRVQDVEFPDWYYKAHAGDYSIVMLFTNKGLIKYHQDVFSVYRINKSSVTYNVQYNAYDKFISTTKDIQLYLGEDFNEIFKYVRCRTKLENKYQQSSSRFKNLFLRLSLLFVNLVIRYRNF